MSGFFNPPQNSGSSGSGDANSGGTFGNASGGTSGGGIFGQASNTASNSAPSGGLFGNGTSTSNTLVPSGSTTLGGNIFGGNKPATGGIFGNNTSTSSTATPAASTSIFGGGPNTLAPSMGSVFGNNMSTSNTATPAAPNSIFGGGSSTTSAPAPSTGSVFGSGGGLFGAKPTDQGTASANKPASSSFFSTPPAPTDQGAASTAKPTSFFANPPSSTAPAAGASSTGGLFGTTPTSNPPAGSGIFGGGSLFGAKKPEEQAGVSTDTAPKTSFFNIGGDKSSAPALSTGGLFGNKAPEKSPTPVPTTGLFGVSKDFSADKKDGAAGLFSAGLLGAPKDPLTDKKDAPVATTSFGLFGASKDLEKKDTTSLGLGQPSTTKEGDKKDAPSNPALALSTLGSSTAVNVSVQPPSMLKGKTIEEIVNRWSSELETHVREFNKFAGEVAVWDRALIENGNNLAALYSHVQAAEREQNDIDQSLDHIEQQQKDLSATLDAYEKSSEEILGGQGGSLRALDTGPADNERDKNYLLATELHTHLDDLSGSLTQMIDSVNTLSLSAPGSGDSKSQQAEDPMAQIAQILGSHLESLQWIGGAVHEVEGKMGEVERGIKDAGLGSGLGGGNKSRGFGLR